MSLISDHKERTAPLTGQELAIIEDEDGLRGIRTELLKGLKGDEGRPGTVAIGSVTSVPNGGAASVTNSGTDTDAVLDFVLVEGPEGPMPDLASPGPIGGTTPNTGTFNQLNIKATSSAATLGPELVTNGTFTANADGWTLGQNWAYGTNNVVLTLDAASEGTLSQTISGIESGALYLVSWTQTHSVANNGTVTARIGTVASRAITQGNTSSGSIAAVITANNSGVLALSFTPSQASNGLGTIVIDNVSVKRITPLAASGILLDVTGGLSNEVRIAKAPRTTFFGLDAGRNTLDAGHSNVALGSFALSSNMTGVYNVAVGANTLANNIASRNCAFGDSVLFSNVTGDRNSAFGDSCLGLNTTGKENSGYGSAAGFACSTGVANTFMGRNAGYTDITANGLTTASNCTFIGAYSGPGNTTQYDYATAIGAYAKVTSANTVVLGRTTDNTVIGATGDDGSGAKLQVTGSIKSTTTVKSGSYAVASLPSAATAGAGARAFVTDANATTFLSVVAGGGSNKVPVVSDGANWLIG